MPAFDARLGPEFDPVWSACEEAGVPLCLHAGSSPKLQYPPFEGLKPTLAETHAIRINGKQMAQAALEEDVDDEEEIETSAEIDEEEEDDDRL